MLPTMSDVPRHIIERMESNLWGAVLCIGGGLLLLIIAVILIRVARRKSEKTPFE